MSYAVAWATDPSDPALEFAAQVAGDVLALMPSACQLPFVDAPALPDGLIGIFAAGHGVPGAILDRSGRAAITRAAIGRAGVRWGCLFGCHTASGVGGPGIPVGRVVFSWRESLPAPWLDRLPPVARKLAGELFRAIPRVMYGPNADPDLAARTLRAAAEELGAWAAANQACYDMPEVVRLLTLMDALVAGLVIDPLPE